MSVSRNQDRRGPITPDRYAAIHQGFGWKVPKRFNMAQACCGQCDCSVASNKHVVVTGGAECPTPPTRCDLGRSGRGIASTHVARHAQPTTPISQLLLTVFHTRRWLSIHRRRVLLLRRGEQFLHRYGQRTPLVPLNTQGFRGHVQWLCRLHEHDRIARHSAACFGMED